VIDPEDFIPHPGEEANLRLILDWVPVENNVSNTVESGHKTA
jgi:hypothetical protein